MAHTYDVICLEEPFHIIDFLIESQDELCARTPPTTVLQTLAYIEKVGDASKAKTIHQQSSVLAMVDHIVAQLTSSDHAGTVHAEPLVIAFLVAFEFIITSESYPRYLRGYAWYQVVELWAGLRADDMRGVPPSNLAMLQAGLEITVRRSKTIGVGRTVKCMVAFVSIHLWLLCPDWLTIGFALWQNPPLAFDRDYFLPRPSMSLEGVAKAEANYKEAAAIGLHLLRLAPRALHNGMAWELTEENSSH